MEKCNKCGEYCPSKLRHRCPSSNHDLEDAVDLVAGVALGGLLFSSDDSSSSSSSDSDSSFGGFDGGDFGGGGSSGEF